MVISLEFWWPIYQEFVVGKKICNTYWWNASQLLWVRGQPMGRYIMGSWRRTEGVTCGTEPTFILFLQSLDPVSFFYLRFGWLKWTTSSANHFHGFQKALRVALSDTLVTEQIYFLADPLVLLEIESDWIITDKPTILLEMQPVKAKFVKEQIKALTMSEQSIWH